MRLRLPRLPAPQYASQSQSSIPSSLTSWPCGCCIFLSVAQIALIRSGKYISAGVHAPLAQSFFAYLLVILLYVPIVLYRRRKLQVSIVEYCVKKDQQVEVVAMLGFFGLLVSTVQVYPLHRHLA
ncbi:hypothetical protein HU200_002625 [Digitaria exilis]|uniref:Uncharacterized protein n=1 Tax=Digitaria exilis TaxID=1010633 RepID=A0A835FV94_9POAL|nr:hypothetical protein HU200_002625 [Digitaria exilis]